MSDELCHTILDISALKSARYAAMSPAQRMIPATDLGASLAMAALISTPWAASGRGPASYASRTVRDWRSKLEAGRAVAE